MLDFLAYLEFERGLSRNTLEAYRSDLLQYGAYLEAHSQGPPEVSGTSAPRGGGQRQARLAMQGLLPAVLDRHLLREEARTLIPTVAPG